MPRVSVVIPAYNAGRFIRKTIESVLAQTWEDLEVILVNDGSTDDTRKIIESFDDDRIHPFHRANSGVSASRNFGVENSRGDLIAFLDADDIWKPEKLQEQIRFIEDHPDHVLAGTWAEYIMEDGTYIYTQKPPVEDTKIKKGLLSDNQFITSSILLNKRAFNETGGFPEKLPIGFEDYYVFYRMSKLGKVHNIPKGLVEYRVVRGSGTIRSNSKDYYSLRQKIVLGDNLIERDLKELEALKVDAKEKEGNGSFGYHYFLGRSYLFENYNKRLAIENLERAVKVNPENQRARNYLLLAKWMPKPVISILYNLLR